MNTWGWIEDIHGASLVQNPSVSAFDSGFTLGYGVFETMKTCDGKIQFLDYHLHRMTLSAQTLKIASPDIQGIEMAMRSVLAKNEPSGYGRLRASLTHGVAGVSPWTLIITWQPIELWTAPARLSLSDVSQSQNRLSKSMKTLSYLENAFALEIAVSNGFDDAILFDTSGHVTETALANLFIVQDETVLTPNASSGCLLGITRHIILEKLSHSFEVREADLSVSDIEAADEIFITSAIRDIQPVECVDSWHYMAPGKITSQLQEIYREYAEGGYQ